MDIENYITQKHEAIHRQEQMQQQQQLQHTQSCSKAAQQSYTQNYSKYSPTDDGYDSGQPDTPTNIQDVYF